MSSRRVGSANSRKTNFYAKPDSKTALPSLPLSLTQKDRHLSFSSSGRARGSESVSSGGSLFNLPSRSKSASPSGLSAYSHENENRKVVELFTFSSQRKSSLSSGHFERSLENENPKPTDEGGVVSEDENIGGVEKSSEDDNFGKDDGQIESIAKLRQS